MATEPACYGQMLPPVVDLALNTPRKGTVFGYEITRSGLGDQERRVSVDRKAWTACRSCGAFDHCYQLSTATTLLEMAVRHA